MLVKFPATLFDPEKRLSFSLKRWLDEGTHDRKKEDA